VVGLVSTLRLSRRMPASRRARSARALSPLLWLQRSSRIRKDSSNLLNPE
jgi:hypothetical protein